mmetsp:Transcript_29438/g.44494  ORF Transcript_29438/g.44494 Transcript_29438/m.44494 type:complete len:204 (-) Transcript_29438:13-624(-)
MGQSLILQDCTSPDNPRVKDCCHLEGETPVEIRIAHQAPRPAEAYARRVLAGKEQEPHPDSESSLTSPLHQGWVDAEKPPYPRGTERVRVPQPWGNRSNEGSLASSPDFDDAERFVEPAEVSLPSPSPGRMDQPRALQMMLPSSEIIPKQDWPRVKARRLFEAPLAREEGTTMDLDLPRGSTTLAAILDAVNKVDSDEMANGV